MDIKQQNISVAELTEGYNDDGEGGVTGYSGKLDIRPPYQREFVYKDKQRDAVIKTVTNKFPLNVMYWAVRDDGTYEIIDGQQRTISIAQYVTGVFSIEDRYFHNLQDDEKRRILDYELTVYLCEGADSEKLEWFKTINIAGEKLTDQELRNAVYAGRWVSDAKRYFSRQGGPAYQMAGYYLKGSLIRQEYLETAIKWINGSDIEGYMAEHQHDASAVALWNYFQSVINWTQSTFKRKRKSMKGVDWGGLYAQYKDADLDPDEIEKETAKLIQDDDVQKKSGIYHYILSGDTKYLNIRQFPDSIKQKVYEAQSRCCKRCGKESDIKGMEADHITPWIEGGQTIEANCQVLCRDCNRRKSAK